MSMHRVSCLVIAFAMAVLAVSTSAGQPEKPSLRNPPAWSEMAPATFKANFDTSVGKFVITVRRSQAPNGADRFYNLVKNGFYDEARFFRVINGSIAQFGIHGEPSVATIWSNARIPSDPPKASNKKGTVTFAMGASPETRTTQVFINLGDNSRLDATGFAPIGEVFSGMDVVEKIYSGYGDAPPRGKGPVQGKIQSEGKVYLAKDFPKLDYIKTVAIEP